MKKINVLSLFDGMSCGRLALDRANIKVKKYYSSEIDKYAIQVADKNNPQDTQYRLGSVVDLKKKDLKKMKIDILIGGSPCQGFSLAGKLQGSATKCGKEVTTLKQYMKLKKEGFEFEGQSYLFWEFVRVWKIVKPKYFFLENVRVTKKWLPMFNKAMGVEPIMINSSLVSAQNRVRFYWTNIPKLKQPKDKGILLKDILEHNTHTKHNLSKLATERIKRHKNKITTCENNPEKSSCIMAGYYKMGGRDQQYLIDSSVKPSVAKNIIKSHSEIIKSDKNFFDMKAESGFQDNKIGLKKSVTLRAGNDSAYVLEKPLKKYMTENFDGVCRLDKGIYNFTNKNKACSLTAGVSHGNKYLIHLGETKQEYTYRKLTPVECARLQTVPDTYCDCVSNSQQYKMLGNGWTIDVISHIFKGLKK